MALARANKRKEAREAFSNLGRTALSPALAQVAEKLQLQLAALPSATAPLARTRGFVKVASQYDTNAAIVPTTNVFSLRNQSSASLGNLINAQIAHDIVASDRRRITASYTALQTINYRIHQVDLQDHALSLSWAEAPKTSTQNFRFGATASYDDLLIAEAAFLQRFVIAPFVTVLHGPRRSTTFSLQYTQKDLLNDSGLEGTTDDRSASNALLGVQHSIVLSDGRTVAFGGYQQDRESAEGGNFSYRGNKFLMGTYGPIPHSRLSYAVQGQYYLRNYDNVSTDFGFRRNDHELTVSTNLAYALKKRLSLSLEFLKDRNISNTSVFDYDREVTSLATTWTF